MHCAAVTTDDAEELGATDAGCVTTRAIRYSRALDGERIIAIRHSPVGAAHSLPGLPDREAIDAEARFFLPAAHFWLAVDEEGEGLGFIGLTGDHIDALFVDEMHRGRGIGRGLVGVALEANVAVTTAVNEQNQRAIGFYRHLGFEVVGRSPSAGRGRAMVRLRFRQNSSRLDTREIWIR